MLLTGNQYRDSIRDGREVWVDGKRVEDVPNHPVFKPIVDVRARIYDMAYEEQFSKKLKLSCQSRNYGRWIHKESIGLKTLRKYISIFRNDHFNSDNIGEFSSIINKIPEINKTDTDFKNKYNEANNLIFNQGLMGSDKIVGDYISNPIQYISSLNNYFIFQKL